VSKLALYGRTYLDAEVEIPIDQLAVGKGKVDVEVRTVLGGFPCNAARALQGRLRGEDMVVVTAISHLDLPRLRAALPPGTHVEAVHTESTDWPTVTVIVNPARECRLLRSGRPGDLCEADLPQIPAAMLHVFGRVDAGLVDAVRRSAENTLLAWCAGAAGGAAIDQCDIACVNTSEARTLLGMEGGSTHELAARLAERGRPHCVRLVTGRGDAPAVAAMRLDGGVRTFEAEPAPVKQDQIRRLKGVGDAFAAHFVVEAVFDDAGHRRPQLDVEGALTAAQAAATRFMTAASV